MKVIVLTIFMCTLLVGCSKKEVIVPVVDKVDPSSLLAKPPSEAMIPPYEPEFLTKGSSNAENSAVMQRNNLNAAKDREKLRVLQTYIKNIFNTR